MNFCLWPSTEKINKSLIESDDKVSKTGYPYGS